MTMDMLSSATVLISIIVVSWGLAVLLVLLTEW